MIDVLQKTKLMTLCLFVGLFSEGCSFLTTCEDAIRGEVRSSGDKFTAVWSVRNCGATTDYSSLVTVTRPGASTDGADVVFVVKGEPEIQLTWQDDTVLRISCDGCNKDEVFKQSSAWRDVSIHY